MNGPTPPPILALTQGDPAGVGPEIVVRVALEATAPEATTGRWRPLVVAEHTALLALREVGVITLTEWERLHFLTAKPTAETWAQLPADAVAVADPVGGSRSIVFGASAAADAAGAVAALDLGIELARNGLVQALVTAPVSKAAIDRHVLPGFSGHTDYIAAACGLERYGRDYLMAFLSADLRVALLSTHLKLAAALELVSTEALGDALDCLARHTAGSIAVAGLNPHAGEGGLFGDEDDRILRPAVAAARDRGLEVFGPESADSVFARARRGEFDWVLALYHDQGLIAVKTASFGGATNWTVGLPFIRTSVDHGTAFSLAGSGKVDADPLRKVVETTLGLIGS